MIKAKEMAEEEVRRAKDEQDRARIAKERAEEEASRRAAAEEERKQALDEERAQGPGMGITYVPEEKEEGAAGFGAAGENNDSDSDYDGDVINEVLGGAETKAAEVSEEAMPTLDEEEAAAKAEQKRVKDEESEGVEITQTKKKGGGCAIL